jgi:hypothetical protein
MWYNRLSEFLLKKGYSNNDDCPCVFIKKSETGLCIFSVYVDDLNIIGNTQDIDEARNHLKTEFEMKDLNKTKFCLGFNLSTFPQVFWFIKPPISRKYSRNSKLPWLFDL